MFTGGAGQRQQCLAIGLNGHHGGLATVRPGTLVEDSLWSQHVIPTRRRDTQAHSLTRKEIGSGRGRRRSGRAASRTASAGGRARGCSSACNAVQ